MLEQGDVSIGVPSDDVASGVGRNSVQMECFGGEATKEDLSFGST